MLVRLESNGQPFYLRYDLIEEIAIYNSACHFGVKEESSFVKLEGDDSGSGFVIDGSPDEVVAEIKKQLRRQI